MIARQEYALAILVIDSSRRYCNERVEVGPSESVEDYAERVKQTIIRQHRQVNS